MPSPVQPRQGSVGQGESWSVQPWGGMGGLTCPPPAEEVLGVRRHHFLHFNMSTFQQRPVAWVADVFPGGFHHKPVCQHIASVTAPQEDGQVISLIRDRSHGQLIT